MKPIQARVIVYGWPQRTRVVLLGLSNGLDFEAPSEEIADFEGADITAGQRLAAERVRLGPWYDVGPLASYAGVRA